MDSVIARFVEYVCDNGACSVGDLMDAMGVCDRTIRKYVCVANEELGSVATLSKERGAGYRMEVHDAEAFDRLRRARFRDGDGTPQGVGERVVSIFHMLISADGPDGWVTMETLASRLFVSVSTISSLFVKVRESLADYGLSIQRRPHYGMRVVGPEFEKRLCFENMVAASGCSRECLSWLVGWDYEQVRQCMTDSLAAAGIVAEATASCDAAVSLAVALDRAGQGKAVSIPDEVRALLVGPRVELMAQCLRRGALERVGVDLAYEERLFVIMHLAFWQDVDEPMEDSFSSLAGMVFDNLERTFRCRFHDDRELQDELVRHVRLLCLRLLYRTPGQVVPVRGVQETLPFSFVLANETCRMVERRSGRPVPDGERDALVFLYAKALSRRVGAQVRRTTAIVSRAGSAVRDYLRCRVQLEFGGDVVCMPSWDALRDSVDLGCVRCVLTTDAVAPKLPVPVVRVGPYFTDDDLVRVRRSYRLLPGTEALASAFGEELFVRRRGGAGTGVVRAVAEAMERAGAAAPGFAERAAEREGDGRCYFGDQVACVYLDSPCGSRTALGCALLGRSATWGDRTVRLVFVLGVADGASEEVVRPLFGAVARLAADREALRRIFDEGSYRSVVDGLLGLAGLSPWDVSPEHLDALASAE